MTDTVTSVAATLVAFAFGLSTLERFLDDRSRHELAWTIALALFAIAAGALAIGSGAGFSAPLFRVFFLFGAIINVPVLALGTVYLLFDKRVGDIAAIAVGLFDVLAVGVLIATPVVHRISGRVLPEGSHVFGTEAQVLAGIGSGAGTIIIVGGALFGIVRFKKGRVAIANVLIALGTLISGASGVLNSAFDKMTAFSVALVAGIVVIFAGFLVAPRRGQQEAIPEALNQPL